MTSKLVFLNFACSVRSRFADLNLDPTGFPGMSRNWVVREISPFPDWGGTTRPSKRGGRVIQFSGDLTILSWARSTGLYLLSP